MIFATNTYTHSQQAPNNSMQRTALCAAADAERSQMKNYNFQDPPHAEPHAFLGSLIITLMIMGFGGLVAVSVTFIQGDGLQFNKGSVLITTGVFGFVYITVLCRSLLARKLGNKKSENLIIRILALVVIIALSGLAVWTNLK